MEIQLIIAIESNNPSRRRFPGPYAALLRSEKAKKDLRFVKLSFPRKISSFPLEFEGT